VTRHRRNSTLPVDSLDGRNDMNLEVVTGLSETDLIVARPDTAMQDGAKVISVKDGEYRIAFLRVVC